MPKRAAIPGLALLALGLLLTGLCLLPLPGDGWLTAALLWLAQPPAALGIALLRGSRDTTDLLADTGRLAARWLGGFATAGLLLAWPLLQLQRAPSLSLSVLLGGLAGVLLVLLWWRWPEWLLQEQQGGAPAALQPRLRTLQRSAWRGLLQVALPTGLLLTACVLAAWPALLPDRLHSAAVWGCLLLLPVVHMLLQSAQPIAAAPTLQGLPIVEMAGAATPATLDPAGEDASASSTPLVDVAELTRQLYSAARNGRVERALALLASGADPHADADANARDRRSLAVLASVLPDLRLLRALIEHGVDVNAQHDGISPLLAATRDSWHGRPEAVMTLLTNGADPRQTDHDGNTPLHHAARSSDPGVAALLRDAGADLDALNHDGQSPLGSACAAGNWRLARFLLERGAKPAPEGGRPALLSAAGNEDDDSAGVQLLLRHKAQVNSHDARQRTALHEAAAIGNAEIVKVLLAAGANAAARDTDGRMPLLLAARAGAVPVLEQLLAAGADPHAVDAAGATALHLACGSDIVATDMVQRLLTLGLNPHTANADGKNALDVAVAAGRWSLVTLFDPLRTPNANTPDEPPVELPPQIALREQLLARAQASTPIALPEGISQRALDELINDREVIAIPGNMHWLLLHGAQPEARSASGTSPISVALGHGDAGIETLQLLFAHGGSPAGRSGLARFMEACLQRQQQDSRAEAFALGLLSRGADPFAADAAGTPPLPLAVRLGWMRLLERLLAMGVDPDSCDARGLTGLHLATSQGRLDIVKLLLRHGGSPDRRGADGHTPLGIALANSNRVLAEWLNWNQWKLPRRPLQARDLPAAAMSGDSGAVQRLLDLGLPIDTRDHQGCTALLRAAGGGHLPLVQLLLERGAAPDIAATSGATPLSAAVSMRHIAIVNCLLDSGCGLEQRLPGDVTVLMLAAALGLPEITTRLLQAGADVHAVDAQGLTPLHCAALYGFTARDRSRLLALLDALLLAGADPQRRSHTQATPLLLLLGGKADPGTPCSDDLLLVAMERLLDEDARIDVADKHGTTPLHLAAQHGLQQVAHALLRAGANPTVRDNAQRSAHDVAMARGYMEIAAELAAPTAAATNTVSMARFLRD